MSDVLEFAGVGVRRGTTDLLKDVDWSIEEGERWVALPAPFNDANVPIVALDAGSDGAVWGATEAELVRFDGDTVTPFASAAPSERLLAWRVPGLAAAPDGAVYVAYAGEERIGDLAAAVHLVGGLIATASFGWHWWRGSRLR